MTHPALDESELYDDDPPVRVVTLPTMAGSASPADHSTPDVAKADLRGPGGAVLPGSPLPGSDRYLAAIHAALDILSYRLILLLSVLVAGGLFGLATWYPDPWRLGAAAAFSVIVVAPLTFFYARR